MGRYRSDEYLAAVNRLPWQQFASPEFWGQNKGLIESGLSRRVMGVLDALAAMCVWESSESYSTALLVEEDAIRLFIASSSGEVPDHVEHRLQSVWQHMCAMHEHDDAPAVRGGDRSRDGWRKLFHEFSVEQYRFGMSALRARLADEAPEVVRALRAVLGCYAPHTAEAAVHLYEHGYPRDAIAVPERRFFERCVTSLEDLRRIAAPDDLSDDTVLHIVQSMESLNKEFKGMISQSDTIFKIIEAISDIPVRFLLQRILWLADACASIPRFAVSSRFAAWTPLRLLVNRVPAMHGPAPPGVDLDVIALKAAMVQSKDPSGQSEDIRNHLLEPLQALLREREALAGSDPGSPPGRRRWQLHGEMALLHHLDALPQPSIIYIGHSELSCLPCYLFLRAYKSHGAHRFYVRGTHGRTPLCWLSPELPSTDTDGVLWTFTRSMSDCFFRAWGSCARAQEAWRGVYVIDEDEGVSDSDSEEGDGVESDYYISRASENPYAGL